MHNLQLTIAVLDAVGAERERQATLIDQGIIRFDCANPSTPALVALPVLIEEVGEVARELQAPCPLPRRLYEELIQTAAVAVAMAEAVMLRHGLDAVAEETDAATRTR